MNGWSTAGSLVDTTLETNPISNGPYSEEARCLGCLVLSNHLVVAVRMKR